MAQTSYSGAITFELETRRETTHLSRVPSKAALFAYAVFLHQYTNAQIESIDFTASEYYEGAYPANPSGDNKDMTFRALIVLRLSNPQPDEHPYKQLIIPAPKLGMFENLEPAIGYRVKKADGEAIAAAYSTLTGKLYTFQRGVLTGG